jgi:LysM repeat protein
MQRNFKLVLSIVVVLLSGLLAFSQEVEYKDVILDGKPAKLNVATGEITLVNPVKKESVITKNKDNVTEADKSSNDYYITKEGETLFDIAKRFKVTMADLKKANNLETTLIDKGQKLRVKNFDISLEEDTKKVSKKTYEPNNSEFHIVSKGETLYSIAKRYSLDIAELKYKNDLNSNLIKVGDKLRIKSFNSNTETYGDAYWLVAKGDTLYSIAKKSGTTVDTLKQLNALNDNTIYVGQKLKLK